MKWLPMASLKLVPSIFEHNSECLVLCAAMGLSELSWAFVDDGFLLDQVMPSPKLKNPSTLKLGLFEFLEATDTVQ